MGVIPLAYLAKYLSIIYDIVFCWACCKALKLRSNVAFWVIHMVLISADWASALFDQTLADAISPLVIVLTYFGLQIVLLEKITPSQILISILMGCGILVVSVCAALAGLLIMGDSIYPVDISLQDLWKIALVYITACAPAALYYLAIIRFSQRKSASINNRIETPLLLLIGVQAVMMLIAHEAYFHLNPYASLLPMVVLTIVFFATLATYALILTRTLRAKENQMRHERIQENLVSIQAIQAPVSERLKRIRRIKHDLANDAVVIEQLARSGDTARAQEMLADIDATLKEVSSDDRR